ncbi:MAG: site-specific integrase [Armatimonadota bacterium]|nr:site-specific integrase [Armatimonadota bacterium]MDR7444796.1 site-specific integrase [Armatimonadota bacterium]MDR7569203.1 site-specific integrase [Armatimonadota bacterium]MDR7613321.1 site-specific integrase [Armatimonadota bacterium]
MEKAARVRLQMASGPLPEPGRLSVAKFAQQWLSDVVSVSTRPSTLAFYESRVRNHIVPVIGGVQIAKLSPIHVQAVLAEMERRGASRSHQRGVLRTLHRMLEQAVTWGFLPRNPCDLVPKPKATQREMCALTPEQAARFLQAARQDRYYALFAVLLGCGLRLGEALALTWPDVDLEGGKITVRRQVTWVKGRPVWTEPKTTAGRRVVDMPRFVVEALRGHQERQRAEGWLLNDQLLVFTDEAGGPVRPENLRRRNFARVLRAAGLPRMRLHDLRHSYATLSLKAGVHPRVVQQQLGHSTVTTTMETYSHVLPGLGREAAERLDRVVRESGA